MVVAGVGAYVVYRHHQEATSLTSTNTSDCKAADAEGASEAVWYKALGAAVAMGASAALAVVKAATLAALDMNGGALSPADRAEVLAAALRAMSA